MTADVISESDAEALVSAARTATGDELRSVTCFTPTDHEQLYLRSDLDAAADMGPFVANERLGFTSQETYGESELGEYVSTIRTFEYGYLTRVIVGGRGVFVTTDGMDLDRFEEVAAALRGVLKEQRNGWLRRGECVGEALMEGVVDHPDLQSVAGLSLLCRCGPVPFYESVGFELFDPEMEVPEGGTEELVRLTDSREA